MNHRKFIFCILALVILPLAGFSQSKLVQNADNAFRNQRYTYAINKYKKAYTRVKRNKAEKNRIWFQLAECYRLTNDIKKAEAAYRRLIKANYEEEKPILLLYYADMLRINNKTEEALLQYKAYQEKAPEDPRGANGVQSCLLINEWKDKPSKYEVANVKKINTKEDDFSPCFMDDNFNTLIFTSSREGAVGKETDEWTGQSFSDLFVARKDRKEEWGAPVLLDNNENINTEANEGTPFMNARYSSLYFTRCLNDKSRKSGCQIYMSKRSGRSFGKAELVSIGNDTVSVFGHPTLSGDELTIYFASDKTGGFGGRDIWMAKRENSTGAFGRPQNLGASVNTPGDEVFPFLRNDTMLYFASNGHSGMGGLDIFKTTLEGKKWSKPVNLKTPVNSSFDDFGIVFEPDAEQGYFSSCRQGGKGLSDIYSFIEPPLIFTLAGTVKDDRTLQFMQGVSVKLIGSNGSSLETKTDPKGNYSFTKSQIKPNTTYEITVSKQNYFTEKGKETTVGLERSKDFIHNFVLKPIPEKPIVLPDILYDLAKWDLKPQYQDSLQGLIKTLDENETLVVELASHTDSRDTEERNDILSQKRAQSVVDYLIQRGIDPDRLIAKGYGERVPRILDKNITKDGFLFKSGTTLDETFIESLKTTEEKEAAHALNRRTEFKVVSKDFVPKPKNAPLTTEQKIDIITQPDVNTVAINILPNNNIEIPCIVDGFNRKIIFEKAEKDLTVSLEQTLKLLQDGAIGKSDFKGDAEKILAEGSVADKAVFTIKEMRIGDKTINNIEAIVSHRLKVPMMFGETILSKFSNFTIDEKKKQLIFK
ncbi:MAG: OmpA family protein [Lentimicrobiaceae bacterium]|nr:OmpA family protein [Lentimicrobiaceae bacterium]